MNSTLRLLSPYSARQLYRNGGSILTRSRLYLRQWSVLILYQSQKLELFWPYSPFHSMIATRDPRDKSLILLPFGVSPRVRQVAATRMKSARIRPPRDTTGTTRIESDRPETDMGVDTYNCKKYGQRCGWKGRFSRWTTNMIISCAVAVMFSRHPTAGTITPRRPKTNCALPYQENISVLILVQRVDRYTYQIDTNGSYRQSKYHYRRTTTLQRKLGTGRFYQFRETEYCMDDLPAHGK